APHEGALALALAEQIAKPVRFVEEIEAMHAAGIRTFVEVGPGSVLTGRVSRIQKGREHRAIALDRKGADGVRAFFGGLAQLAAAGVPMRFAALWEEERAPIDPRTVVKPRMTVKLNGANVGKPYPPPEGAEPLRPAQPLVIGGSADAAPPPPPAVAPIEAPRVEAPAVDATLVEAFLETQRQSAEAHAAYQPAVAHASSAARTAIRTRCFRALLRSREIVDLDRRSRDAPTPTLRRERRRERLTRKISPRRSREKAGRRTRRPTSARF